MQIFGGHADLYNAEIQKTHVWISEVSGAKPRIALGAFTIVVPQQAYSDPPSIVLIPLVKGHTPPVLQTITTEASAPQIVDLTLSALFVKSLVKGQTPPLIASIYGSPQSIDFTVQAILSRSSTPHIASPVSPFVQGSPQTDPTQMYPPLAPAATPSSNAVAWQQYFGIHAQAMYEYALTRAVWPSQRKGAAPTLGSSFTAGPQLVDLTVQALLSNSAITHITVIPVIAPFFSGAPQVIDLTQRSWLTQPTLNPQGFLFTVITASPDPTELPNIPSWLTSASSHVLITGPTVPIFAIGQPQTDISDLYSAIYNSAQISENLLSLSWKQTFGAHAYAIYEYAATRSVWPSITSASRPTVPWTYFEVPPQVDLTPPSWTIRPTPNLQGKLGQYVSGYPTDPSQLAAQIFKALHTPPPNYNLPLIIGTPQLLDLTQQGFIIRPLVGHSGKLGAYVSGAPQQIDLTQREWLFVPVVMGIPPVIVPFKGAGPIVGIFLAERMTGTLVAEKMVGLLLSGKIVGTFH